MLSFLVFLIIIITVTIDAFTVTSDIYCGIPVNGDLPEGGKHYYRLMLPVASTITVDNCATSYDTQLFLVDAAETDLSSSEYCWPSMGSAGDDCGNCGFNEEFTMSVSAGTYYVKFEGLYDSNYGPYELSVTCTNIYDTACDTNIVSSIATNGIHAHKLELTTETNVHYETCASAIDPTIRILNAIGTDISSDIHCIDTGDDGDDCGRDICINERGRSAQINGAEYFDIPSMQPGTYWVLMAPWGTSSGGGYEILIDCYTDSPTAAPTDITTAPTTVTVSPTTVTIGPTSITAFPTTNTPAPTANTAAPTSDTGSPTSDTSAPTASTLGPTSITASPTANTPRPTAITATPTTDTGSPTSDTSAPTAATPGPTSITASPTANTPAPTDNRAATDSPTASPTSYPTENTNAPTSSTTTSSTSSPTNNPTVTPSTQPTTTSTINPTQSYTNNPTQKPTPNPTSNPSLLPTIQPTQNTNVITSTPTNYTTLLPTTDPSTYAPSENPSNAPTSKLPTTQPSIMPSKSPTKLPTTSSPTTAPSTSNPSVSPITSSPTINSSTMPTANPTETTLIPTNVPSISPTTSIPSVSPTTSEPTMSPSTYIPTETPRNKPRYWICDESCKSEKDDEDNKIEIKVSYMFSDGVRYNLKNMECFLYAIFERWFHKYLFVDTFDICDIQIGTIYGGIKQENNTLCEFGPCLLDSTTSSIRRLSANNNGNTTMTIITDDSNTYQVIKSLSLNIIESEFETEFKNNFGVDLDVIILLQDQKRNELNPTNNTFSSSLEECDALCYIIGLLVVLLCFTVCGMIWYIRRSHQRQRKLTRKMKNTLDNVHVNQLNSKKPHNYSEQVSRVSSESQVSQSSKAYSNVLMSVKNNSKPYTIPLQPVNPTDTAMYIIEEDNNDNNNNNNNNDSNNNINNNEIEMVTHDPRSRRKETNESLAISSSNAFDEQPASSSSDTDSTNDSDSNSDKDNDDETKEDVQPEKACLMVGSSGHYEISIDVDDIEFTKSSATKQNKDDNLHPVAVGTSVSADGNQTKPLDYFNAMLQQMPTSAVSGISWEQQQQQLQKQMMEWQKRQQQMMGNIQPPPPPTSQTNYNVYNNAMTVYQQNVTQNMNYQHGVHETMGINSILPNTVYNLANQYNQQPNNHTIAVIEEQSNISKQDNEDEYSSSSSGDECDNDESSHSTTSDTEGDTESDSSNGDGTETIDNTLYTENNTSTENNSYTEHNTYTESIGGDKSGEIGMNNLNISKQKIDGNIERQSTMIVHENQLTTDNIDADALMGDILDDMALTN